MAVPGRPFGKDRVERSSAGFIEHALTGGSGESEGVHNKKINRPDQSINTVVPMDNVKLCCPMESSILDEKWSGSLTNLDHSLTGASAVNEKLGAKGGKSTIFPNH